MVPFILVHVALASLQLKGAGKCRLAVQPGEGERDGSKAWLQSLIDSQNLILSEPHGTGDRPLQVWSISIRTPEGLVKRQVLTPPAESEPQGVVLGNCIFPNLPVLVMYSKARESLTSSTLSVCRLPS